MDTEADRGPGGGKIKRGVAIMTTTRVVQRGLGILRLVMLTHWLSPEEVGTVATAVLAIDTLNMLTVTGLASAVIQRREAVLDCLDAVWTFQLCRSIALVLLGVSLAPVIGWLTGQPTVTGMIQVLAVMLLLNGLSSGAAMMLRRDLEFGPLAVAQALGALVDLIITLSLVAWTHSPWAMVAGQLAQSTVNAIASYRIHPFRPRLDFAWGKLRSLLRSGMWIGASNILLFLSRRMDDLLVMLLAGTAALGVYQPAYRLANLPGTEGTDVLAGVFFPAYARMHADPARARALQRRVFLLALALTVPFAILLLLAGPWATRTLFGPEWAAMGGILQILAVQGALAALAETARPVLFAQGRSRVYAAVKALNVAVFIGVGVPLILHWGVPGAATATAIAAGLTLPITLWAAWRKRR